MTTQSADRSGAAWPQDAARLRLLATLLAMPEEGALDALREVRAEVEWLGEAVDELERLPLDQWQAEHTRLFVTGYPKTPCPPFESAYRHRQMAGAASQDLQGLYRRAGLQPQDVSADYLGTQLDFAAFLSDMEQGGEGCLVAELQSELWEEHLRPWLPRFARDLRESAQLLLYRCLGEQLGLLLPEAE